MADESTATSEATTADFDPSDLETPAKAAEPQEEDREGQLPEDFDPSEDEFDVSVPQKEDEKPPEKTEGKKEEKKAEGGKDGKEPKRTEAEAKPVAEGENSRAEPAAPKPSEKEPEKPKLVKVKLDEDEYEVPEKLADKWEATVTKAKAIHTATQTLVGNLREGKIIEPILELLSRDMKDPEKADALVTEAAAKWCKAKIEFMSLPQEQQQAIKAKEKAARLQQELDAIKAAHEKETKARARQEAIDSMFVEVVHGLKDIGADKDKDLAFAVVEKLDFLRQQGQRPDVKTLIQYVKKQRDGEVLERDRRYQAGLNDMTDDELLKRHAPLVERLRAADLAKLKAERQAAKTAKAAAKPNEPERETGARSKVTVLNTKQWDDYFGSGRRQK